MCANLPTPHLPQMRMASPIAASLLPLAGRRVLASDASGAVKLFSDIDCTEALQSLPGLSINACFDTGQAVAISVKEFPQCTEGQPTLYISDQKQCGRPSILPMTSTSMIGQCVSFALGTEIESAAFQCLIQHDDTVTRSAQTASTPVPRESLVTESKSATSPFLVPISSTYVPSATATTAPTKGSGLSRGEEIGMAAGLVVAFAGLIIAIITLKYTRQAALGEPPPPYSECPPRRR